MQQCGPRFRGISSVALRALFERRLEDEMTTHVRTNRCLEKDLFHCFRYFSFPQDLWKTIRTTSIL